MWTFCLFVKLTSKPWFIRSGGSFGHLCTQDLSAILEGEGGLLGQGHYKEGLVIHPVQASVPFTFRFWEHEDLLLASLGHEAGPWSFLAGLEFTSNC